MSLTPLDISLGITGWYDGYSYDNSNSKWTDKTGLGNDLSVTGTLTPSIYHTPAHLVSYRNNKKYMQKMFKYIAGSTTSRINFPTGFLADTSYTLFHVARRDPNSTNLNGRIFDDGGYILEAGAGALDGTGPVNTDGSANASSWNSPNYPPIEAFNGTISSNSDGWLTAIGNGAALPFPHWLSFEFPTEKYITKYKIWARNHNDYVLAPKDWQLLGIRDGVINSISDFDYNIGSSYTIIDTRSNETNWVQTTGGTADITNDINRKECYVANPGYYKYYVLHITANNNSNNSYVSIAQTAYYSNSNWYSGFNDASSGVTAHDLSYVNTSDRKYGNNWVVSVDRPNYYRSIGYSDFSSGYYDISSGSRTDNASPTSPVPQLTINNGNTTSINSLDISYATGGIINRYELDGQVYCSHTFVSDGIFNVTQDISVDFLIVAGGGAGSRGQTPGGSTTSNKGGGGGAGGLIYDTDQTLHGGTTYSVVVGAGGLGDNVISGNVAPYDAGHKLYANGKDSEFNGYIAKGGGYGGVIINNTLFAGAGGSGGGARARNSGPNSAPPWPGGIAEAHSGDTLTQGSPTPNEVGVFGNDGGSTGPWNLPGGGGGGAGQVGSDGIDPPAADNYNKGGDGKQYSIRNGTLVYYAGGGGGSVGGGIVGVAAAGGAGGGGAGSSEQGQQVNTPNGAKHGTDYTGGGGGGAWGDWTKLGGNGGNGIVVIRYKIHTSDLSDLSDLSNCDWNVAEVFAYNKHLTSTEEDSLADYLKFKYLGTNQVSTGDPHIYQLTHDISAADASNTQQMIKGLPPDISAQTNLIGWYTPESYNIATNPGFWTDVTGQGNDLSSCGTPALVNDSTYNWISYIKGSKGSSYSDASGFVFPKNLLPTDGAYTIIHVARRVKDASGNATGRIFDSASNKNFYSGFVGSKSGVALHSVDVSAGAPAPAPAADPFSATGGNYIITYTSGGINYKVHVFTTSSTLIVTGSKAMDLLVVGGGGAGGAGRNGGDEGGAGGAGKVVYFSGETISSDVSCVVGLGAVASSSTQVDGDDTTLAYGSTTVNAKGGGGGGRGTCANGGDGHGGDGGSGGGASCTDGGASSRQGDASDPPPGAAGGQGGNHGSPNTQVNQVGYWGSDGGGTGNSSWRGFGGGGAGEKGGGDSNTPHGGDGKPYEIRYGPVSGTQYLKENDIEISHPGEQWYGGGGGGRIQNHTRGLGGTGGGGNAVDTKDTSPSSPQSDEHGAEGRGGGGGGGWASLLNSHTGGNGGDGIVIIRYEI